VAGSKKMVAVQLVDTQAVVALVVGKQDMMEFGATAGHKDTSAAVAGKRIELVAAACTGCTLVALQLATQVEEQHIGMESVQERVAVAEEVVAAGHTGLVVADIVAVGDTVAVEDTVVEETAAVEDTVVEDTAEEHTVGVVAQVLQQQHSGPS